MQGAEKEADESLSVLQGLLQSVQGLKKQLHERKGGKESAGERVSSLKMELAQLREQQKAANIRHTELCTTNGSLQEANEYKEKRIAMLEEDLAISKQTKKELLQRLEDLEDQSLRAKKKYATSFEPKFVCRADTPEADANALSVPEKLFNALNQLDSTAQPPSNKRQRLQQGTVQEEDNTDNSVPSAELVQTSSVFSKKDAGVQTSQEVEAKNPSKECSACEANREESRQAVNELRHQLQKTQTSMKEIQDKHNDLYADYNDIVAQKLSLTQTIEAKEREVSNLRETLRANNKSKETKSESKEPVDKLKSRLQLLEDNVAQMNGYADHLELIIGQCSTCSGKLQSYTQPTQD